MTSTKWITFVLPLWFLLAGSTVQAQSADNYVGYSISGGSVAAWNVTEGQMDVGGGFIHTY